MTDYTYTQVYKLRDINVSNEVFNLDLDINCDISNSRVNIRTLIKSWF